MGIKKKILLTMIMVVSVLLAGNGIVASSYFASVLKEQVIKDNKDKLKQIALQLNSFQEDVIRFTQYVMLDSDIDKLVRQSYSSDTLTRVSSMNMAMEKIKNVAFIKSYFYNALIITNENKVYATNSQYEAYFQDVIKKDWYVDFMNSDDNSAFTQPYEVDANSGKIKVIGYINRMNDLSGKNIKAIIVNINLDYFNTLLGDITLGFNEFKIYDRNKNVLFTNSQENTSILHPDQKVPDGLEKIESYTIISEGSMKDNWLIACAISEEAIYDKIKFVNGFFLLTTLLCLIIIILITYPMLAGILNPVSKLAKSMDKVSSSNLDVSINIKSGDELELLSNKFNEMITNLKAYIADIIYHEKKEREMEMDLLISQINPHFIYNTLNTVVYLSQDGRNNDIKVMMEAFIGLLQDTVRLGEGETYAKVAQEKEMVDKYALIQQYRYPDLFLINWKIEESLMDTYIPKTIIQPLVENALYHGIFPKGEFGTIDISIQKTDDEIMLTVEDDGVGMDDDKLNALLIQSSDKSGTGMKSIGLQNIRSRVFNLNGTKSGFTITTHKNIGTKVSISIFNRISKEITG